MSVQGGIVPVNFLQKLHIYQTRSRIYVLGFNKRDKKCSVLKLNRQDGRVLDAVEDSMRYTVQECNSLLRRIHEGNSHHGGLQYLCKAYGIIGCFRFTEGYYLFVITKREKVGTMCGHKVYRIVDTAMMPVGVQYRLDPGPGGGSPAEKRYRRLLQGLELGKEFYFSYSYPLPCTLQRNITQPPPQSSLPDNMFVWNAYLTSELRQAVGSSQWTVPLIHGFWEQRVLSVFGRSVAVTLVARRSRHFAGTRYKKRGLNDQGRVANEVETEQIVDAGVDWRTGQPMWSSVVQLRGSIPLFWSQQPTPLSPKPDILLQRFDPMYHVTNLHFQDLRERYGNPIVVLNLLRSAEKRPRETLLRQELASAVQLLNSQVAAKEKIMYIPWDFSKYAKMPGANILLEISTVIKMALEATGIFVHHRVPAPTRRTKPLPVPPDPTTPSTKAWSGARLQAGVLRTNCIDCLDRTNVAQFAFGLMSFGHQLHHLRLTDEPEVDPESSVALALMEMYEGCGHTLALQYGGSEAHSVFFHRKKGDWEAAAQSKDLVTSIKRFYSNTYMDSEKQDAINLLLGNFVPRAGQPHLWDLDSDVYLHSQPWLHHSLESNPQPRHNATSQLSPQPTAGAVPAPTDPSTSTQATPAGETPPATPFAALQLESSAAHQAMLAETLQAMPNMHAAGGMAGLGEGDGSSVLVGGGLSEELSLDPIGYQASEGGWDFRVVLSQLLAVREATQQLAGGGTAEVSSGALALRKTLFSFDAFFTKHPRIYHVRLYGSSARRNLMWGALQQAFAFFWTLPEFDSLRTSQDASSPPQSPTTFSPTASLPPPRPFPPSPSASLPAPPGPSTSITSAPLAPPPAPGPAPAPTLQRRPSFSLPSPTRLISDLAASLTQAKPPPPPTISPLNDILEIKGSTVSPATLAALRGVPYHPPPTPSAGPSQDAAANGDAHTGHPSISTAGGHAGTSMSFLQEHFAAHTPPPLHPATDPNEPVLAPLPWQLVEPLPASSTPPSPFAESDWQVVGHFRTSPHTAHAIDHKSCARYPQPTRSAPVPPSTDPNERQPSRPARCDHLLDDLLGGRPPVERDLGMACDVQQWWCLTDCPPPSWVAAEHILRAGCQQVMRDGMQLPEVALQRRLRQHYRDALWQCPLRRYGLVPLATA